LPTGRQSTAEADKMIDEALGEIFEEGIKPNTS
jgi:hypothetical protein